MKNLVLYGQSKHTDIRFHFIQECVKHGQIVKEYVNSKDQWANIFTKIVAHLKHNEMWNMSGVMNTELSWV